MSKFCLFSIVVAVFCQTLIYSFRIQRSATRANGRSTSLEMKVSAKSEYRVTLLPGDGIGPEIMSATTPVLHEIAKKYNFKFNFQEADIGGIAYDNHGDPFPDISYELCKTADSVLLACIGGYKWDNNPRHLRPESGLLRLRKNLGLYANLRPAKVIPALIDASTVKKEVIEGVDIMIVRELTGGIYFGQPRGIEADPTTGIRRGYNSGVYTEPEIERIAKVAIDVASKRSGKLCSVDKANVLEVSQLWREVVTREVEAFPVKNHVTLSHMYVDNCAMQLIRYPRQFDTIVTGNMFGDILSDEASMLVGSLGLLPSASLGDGTTPGVFEPCHGSAPDIAGQDLANPLAMILSAAMMLRYDLDQPIAADTLEKAVDIVLNLGYRTKDIYLESQAKEITLIGCKRMGEEVVKALQAL